MPSKHSTQPTRYTTASINGIPLIRSADNIELTTTFTAEQFSYLALIKKKLGSKKEQDAVRFLIQRCKEKEIGI